MAYSRLYGCDRVMLLYPHHNGLPAAPIYCSYGIAAPEGADRLIVAAVDVSASPSSFSEALASLVTGYLSPVATAGT